VKRALARSTSSAICFFITTQRFGPSERDGEVARAAGPGEGAGWSSSLEWLMVPSSPPVVTLAFFLNLSGTLLRLSVNCSTPSSSTQV
jgi:hypothetical protein